MSGPNTGKHVSNGSCDCDRDEWTAPANLTANTVTLAFQNDQDAATGAGADPSRKAAFAEYLHGVQGVRHAMRPFHRPTAAHKRHPLINQALAAGRHFRHTHQHGTAYSPPDDRSQPTLR